MEKDPAVLFYTKDWIEGTVDMFPNEKGVYIDLLCYQHQKGFLPNDPTRMAKIAGVSKIEFLEIWQKVRLKFILITTLDTSQGDALTEWKNTMVSEGKSEELVNFRMLKETIGRRKISTKKSVQAYVTNWLRYHRTAKNLTEQLRTAVLNAVDYGTLVKKGAKKKEVYDHLNYLTQKLAERLQKGNGDGNGDGNNKISNNLIYENEDAKKIARPIEKKLPLGFERKLKSYFSLPDKYFEQSGTTELEKLSRVGKLEHFISQTKAYMEYKTISQERRHGWAGYLEQWDKIDWVQKLAIWKETRSKPKPTFAINR